MKITLVGLLFFLISCNSNTDNKRKEDSSQVMDSSIMKGTDSADGGLDTSVIDTSATGLK